MRVPLALLLGPAVVSTARGEVYLTEAQAAAAIFPGNKLSRRVVALSEEDAKAVRAASGQAVRSRSVVCWTDGAGRAVLVDQVLGKHDYIAYAVGIGPDGKVAGVEILEYREAFGSQVRGAAWR